MPVVPKKKRSLLPVLTVLFLVSYALMTMLIVEQGSAIQSQSNLIKVLMPDSRELWDLKAKAIGDKQKAKTQAHGHAGASAQTPSAESPSTQSPQPHSQSRLGKSAKPDTQVPPVPASDLIDQRRALHTI
jgi:hypothetical protein